MNPIANQIRQATERPRQPGRRPSTAVADFEALLRRVLRPVLTDGLATITQGLGGDGASIRGNRERVILSSSSTLAGDDQWTITFSRRGQSVLCETTSPSGESSLSERLAVVDVAWARARLDEWISAMWPAGSYAGERKPLGKLVETGRGVGKLTATGARENL